MCHQTHRVAASAWLRLLLLLVLCCCNAALRSCMAAQALCLWKESVHTRLWVAVINLVWVYTRATLLGVRVSGCI